MAFCEFCGKQLADGEQCTCGGAQGTNPVPGMTGAPTDQVFPQPGFPQPGNPDSSAGGSTAGDLKETAKKAADAAMDTAAKAADKAKDVANDIATQFREGDQKKKAVMAGIGAAAVIVLILLCSLVFGGKDYEKPLKQLAKGFNKPSIEAMFDAMIPKDVMKEAKDDLDKDEWKEMVEGLDEMLEDSIEDMEDLYGDKIKLSFKVLSKSKLDEDEIEDADDEFMSMGSDKEVSKGYKVKVKLTIKGSDDKSSQTVKLTVVKLKGDGWKLLPSSMSEMDGMGSMFYGIGSLY